MKMYWLYPCILLSASKYFFFTIKMLCILQTLKMKSNNHDGYNGINIHVKIILKKKGCTGADDSNPFRRSQCSGSPWIH